MVPVISDVRPHLSYGPQMNADYPKKIMNRELMLADVPEPGSGWNSISRFSLSFDGYEYAGSFEACADIAYRVKITKDGSLSDLRTFLFFMQRSCNHVGSLPDSDDMQIVSLVLEKIINRLSSVRGV